jgi:ribosomal protein L15
MKDKNLPDDNNSKSLEELTQEANSIIEELEKQKDIKNSLDDYQKLIKLNNIIERKFQKKSKSISQNMKEKIENITKKKNVKQSK